MFTIRSHSNDHHCTSVVSNLPSLHNILTSRYEIFYLWFCWPLICTKFLVQMRNPKEVEKDEYNEFYKKTFNEFLDPLANTHFTTEVCFESVIPKLLYSTWTELTLLDSISTSCTNLTISFVFFLLSFLYIIRLFLERGFRKETVLFSDQLAWFMSLECL